MNKRKIALIGVIVALFLSGCASVQDGQSGGANDVGLSASSDVIGAKEAEKAALDHAGFTSDQVIFTKSEYDRDSKEYEIEFTADDYRYEYDIGAADGSIIEFSKKIIDSAHDTSGATSSTTQTTHTTTTPKTPAASTTPPGTGEAVSAPPPISDTSSAPSETGRITLDEAKAAALGHAGVTASEVTFTKNKLDYDDGREEYDIEFVSGDYEYEYEIDAASGEVLSYSKEARSRQSVANAAAGSITLDEAKAAALGHAGVTASEVTFTKNKLDYDDGREEYDIEFVSGDYEYEYEIDAASGEVLSYSKEARSRQAVANAAAGRITLDEAKALALGQEGLAESEVTFIKTILDSHGTWETYEIIFVTEEYKCKYKIDAGSGTVLSDSKETRKGQTISTEVRITLDEAKGIALGHAGFDVSEVTFTKAKLDHDDDGDEYEIEFYANGREYEYSIDAVTGEIIEYDMEH